MPADGLGLGTFAFDSYDRDVIAGMERALFPVDDFNEFFTHGLNIISHR